MRKTSQQPKQLFIQDLGNVFGGAHGKATTFALGEEDGALDPIKPPKFPAVTTKALGEEDGGGNVTSLALGEEDSGF